MDDDHLITDMIQEQLWLTGYEAHSTNDSTRVIELLKDNGCDLVLLDIDMPPPNGLTLLREIRKRYPFLAIVMLTGLDDAETAAHTMREGATDYIVKSSPQAQLVSRIERALEYSQLLRERAIAQQTLERRVDEQTHQLRAQSRQLSQMLDRLSLTYQATVKALEAALDIGDQSAPGHCGRVAKLSVRLATQLGIKGHDLVALEYGALLHDIGKLGIPDTILMKPGPLTPEEWTTMRRHPEIGCEIVGNIDFLEDALPIIRHHHEHYDGNGYPDALPGDEIPILARIFAVIDSFDAQTNWRPYNIAHSAETALENIRKYSGSLYDPYIVDAFIRMIREQGVDVEVKSPGLGSLATLAPELSVRDPALSEKRSLYPVIGQESQRIAPWPTRILAVDDETQVTSVIGRQLASEGFDVTTTNDSTKVLGLLNREHNDLVLLDINMSPPDGLTLLREIRKRHPFLAIVMLTASDDAEMAARSMREGATDYIVKPYKQAQLVSRIERALEYSQLLRERAMAQQLLERRVEEQTRKLRTQSRQLSQMLDRLLVTYRATVKTLEAALDAGDQSAPGHCRRVAKLSDHLARRLGIKGNDLVALEYGALLHDIGKLGIPDTILMKPGPLTPEEWDIMRRHPALGCEIVGNIDFLEDALPIIRHHHEHYNGNGYPDGLRGDEIPILARIFAVIDSFDAQTNWRPYKDTFDADTALQNIQADRGVMYDPAIVDAFTDMVREQQQRTSPYPMPPSG